MVFVLQMLNGAVLYPDTIRVAILVLGNLITYAVGTS